MVLREAWEGDSSVAISVVVLMSAITCSCIAQGQSDTHSRRVDEIRDSQTMYNVRMTSNELCASNRYGWRINKSVPVDDESQLDR